MVDTFFLAFFFCSRVQHHHQQQQKQQKQQQQQTCAMGLSVALRSALCSQAVLHSIMTSISSHHRARALLLLPVVCKQKQPRKHLSSHQPANMLTAIIPPPKQKSAKAEQCQKTTTTAE